MSLGFSLLNFLLNSRENPTTPTTPTFQKCSGSTHATCVSNFQPETWVASQHKAAGHLPARLGQSSSWGAGSRKPQGESRAGGAEEAGRAGR